jgi:hypothetical protein
LSREEELSITEAVVSGQQRIYLAKAGNLKKGQQICIFCDDHGEIQSIVSVSRNSILLDCPLDSTYLHEETSLILLRRVSLFFDKATGVIRRKVNASPPQPLLEEVSSFGYELIEGSNLIRLDLRLLTEEGKDYETTIFPKNTALFTVR